MSPRAIKALFILPFVVGAMVVTLFAVLMGAAVEGGAGAPDAAAPAPAPCVVSVSGVNSPDLDAAQLGNARVIIATGAQMGVPTRGHVIAIATAMQESTLRNLTWGDRDSVGLFQQRPSQGWGTVAELTTPSIASRKFYDALLKVRGWQGMPLTVAAQTVQRSGFPLAYAKWEPLATRLVTGAQTVGGLDCGSDPGISVGDGAVGTMLRTALAQQGEPYVWGATGPDSFDCSGLIVYSWRQAGFRLTIRTAAQMYANSTPIASGSEQPGDLLFSEFDADGPGHVSIVVRKGLTVTAPRTGDVVKLREYSPSAQRVFGRLKRSVFEEIPTGT